MSRSRRARVSTAFQRAPDRSVGGHSPRIQASFITKQCRVYPFMIATNLTTSKLYNSHCRPDQLDAKHFTWEVMKRKQYHLQQLAESHSWFLPIQEQDPTYL